MGNEKEFDKDRGELPGRDHGYGYLSFTGGGDIDINLEPQKYKCPECGIILADDTSLEDIGNGFKERVCNACYNPVVKKFKCPNCRIILAEDTYFKDLGNGFEEPVCKKCKNPVEEYNKPR